MILVDTSVWIDHLHRHLDDLAQALELEDVVVHPFVIGEIACGTIRSRDEVLLLLRNLPRAPVATNEEVLTFIDDRQLMGRGLGYVDVHLLASAALGDDLVLWTSDKRLQRVARSLKLSF